MHDHDTALPVVTPPTASLSPVPDWRAVTVALAITASRLGLVEAAARCTRAAGVTSQPMIAAHAVEHVRIAANAAPEVLTRHYDDTLKAHTMAGDFLRATVIDLFALTIDAIDAHRVCVAAMRTDDTTGDPQPIATMACWHEPDGEDAAEAESQCHCGNKVLGHGHVAGAPGCIFKPAATTDLPTYLRPSQPPTARVDDRAEVFS